MHELTVDDLMELHAKGIREHGGIATVPVTARDRMGSVLHSASYHVESGVLAYASSILCYIARAQHFTDGNKRAAWLGCVRALEINGFYLKVETVVAVAFVDDIVINDLEVAEIAERLSAWIEVIE